MEEVPGRCLHRTGLGAPTPFAEVLSHRDGAAKPSSQPIRPIEHHDLVSRVRERVQRLIAALHVPEGVPEVIPAIAGQSRAFTSCTGAVHRRSESVRSGNGHLTASRPWIAFGKPWASAFFQMGRNACDLRSHQPLEAPASLYADEEWNVPCNPPPGRYP
jgi:hypothetical protein